MKGRRKIVRTPGGQLDKLSVVTPEDVARAVEGWKADAKGPARQLLNATHPPDPAEQGSADGTA